MNQINSILPRFYHHHKTLLWTWGIPLALFLLALLVRVPSLGEFLTVDEPRWLDRSRWFLGGLLYPNQTCPTVEYGRDFVTNGLACTFQIAYPGVTVMWGGSLGLLLHYWQTVQPAGLDLATYLQNLNSYTADPGVIIPVRLPLAIFSALFISIFYLLTRRLLDETIALIAAFLLALQPFHIALSRVLHHDVLNTTFMTLSFFAMVGYWLKGWRWYWLVISAVMGGLALLTKPVSWFLIPFMPTLGVFTLYFQWRTQKWHSWKNIRRLVIEGMAWGVVVVLTVFAFFPAMWVIPGQVIQAVFDTSTGLVEAGQLHYFLGKVTREPGPLFYPIGWLLRASPVEMLGLAALSVALIYEMRLRSKKSMYTYIMSHPVEIALLLYLVTFLAFETVAAKKLIRYLLPAFPIIDIFSAVGLFWLINKLNQLRHTNLLRQGAFILIGIILFFQGWFVWNTYPYYFTYFNPLLGGAPGAARIMDVGWGEGLNEAAAYLNQLPNAKSLRVTTCRANYLFAPFFIGKNLLACSSPKEIMQADYVVYYILNLMVKENLYWPYFQNHYPPVYRVNLNGLDYALIYRNPIEHSVNEDNKLRLGTTDYGTIYGYSVNNDGLLRLYWHNSMLARHDLMVSLAPIDNTQSHWVTCQAAPGFADEMHTPDTIVESICPLAEADAPPGMYDLHLGLRENNTILPIPTSGIAFISIDPDGHIEQVELAAALETGLKQALPKDVIPLDIMFGDRLRLVGYKLEPMSWQPSQTGDVVFYWQPIRRPDFGLAQAYQLTFSASADGNTTPPRTTYPILPDSLADREIARSSIISTRYTVPLSGLAPGSYALSICLVTTNSGQVLANTKFSGCLPVPITIK